MEARIATRRIQPRITRPNESSSLSAAPDGAPEKKARMDPDVTLKYGDEWEKKKLESATAILIQPPDIPDRVFVGDFRPPAATAISGHGIESLAKTKNAIAYAIVCRYDNLEAVKRLEFFTTDTLLIESCVVSAFSNANAGYRVAGYLLNPVYPMTFIGPGRAWLFGYWARGFGSLPWPEDSWLDNLPSGPKFAWNKNSKLVPVSTTEEPVQLNSSGSMPLAFRASRVVYQTPDPPEEVTKGMDEQSAKEAAEKWHTKELRKQRFLNQASKLFVLAEYFGYGEALLMCGFFLSPPPDAGYQFAHKGATYIIPKQAAENASKVVARLIGWHEP